MASPVSTDAIVRAARGWIGTPYHHQASCKLVGTDCLGLVRGVFREIYGREAEMPPPYSADWAEALAAETLLEAASRQLLPTRDHVPQSGDVLIFRMRRGTIAKHAGVATGSQSMVHALETIGTVEVAINGWWRRRIAGIFRFPGVES
ncbi:MAG: C40 family peptidase [Hyphomicrobiaceae bacterium]|nr:C40 family peptidase [Hyphomicrobiaceae bacterium]